MSSSVEPPPEDQHVLGPVAKLAVELGRLMVIDPYHQLHLRRTHSDQPVLRGVHQETPQTLALVGGPNGQVVQPAAVPIEADQDRADDLPTGMSNQHLRADVFASPAQVIARVVPRPDQSDLVPELDNLLAVDVGGLCDVHQSAHHGRTTSQPWHRSQ